MKNLIFAILIIVVLGAGWFYFSSENQTDGSSNLPVQSSNVSSDDLEAETKAEYPFSISNVTVFDSVVKIDDGNPQTNDNSFDVTWEYRAGNEPSNAYISFSVVDRGGNIISAGLKGAGAAKSYLNESATLKMPPLCSTVPTEGCMATEDFNPNDQYRLKITGANCLNNEINPGYCNEEDREQIQPVYSNWFQLSE